MQKLVSRVSLLRSERSRLEGLADPSKMSGLDEKDPESVARWMKKVGKEIGEDAGEDFDDSVDEAMGEAAKEGGEDGQAGDGGDEDF